MNPPLAGPAPLPRTELILLTPAASLRGWLALWVALLVATIWLPPTRVAAAPIIGAQLFATGGDIVVEVRPATAGFVSELWLYSPGPAQFIALNTDVGQTVNIGSFPAGTELVFGIFVRNTGFTYQMGPGSRNPDGIPHAAVDIVNPGDALVGFEDIFGGGDLDYDDNVFRFVGGIAPLACPADLTLEAPSGSCSVVVNYTEPVVDGATVVCEPPSGSEFPLGTTTVTCVATYLTGETRECSFTVTVLDRTAPTIVCPANITVPNDPGVCEATVALPEPAVSDNCDGATVGGSGTLYYTRFCTVPNVKKVRFHYDGSSFLLDPPADVSSLAGADGIIFAPDGYLLVGGQGDLVHRVNRFTGTSSSVTAGGTASFHLALDPSGTKAWSMGIPGQLAEIPLTPFANGIPHPLSGDDTAITSIAFDTLGNAYYTASGPAGNGAVGRIDLTTFTTTRTLSGIEAAHGMTFDPYTGHLILYGDDHVTQVDPATMTIVSDRSFPGSQFDQGTVDGTGHAYVADNNGRLLFVDYAATGLIGDPANFVALQPLDTCLDDIAPLTGLGALSPPPVVTCTRSDSRPLTDPFPVGTTTVTCTATDRAGNSSSCSYTVTVEDRERPAVNCPADLVVANDPGLCSAVVAFTPTATDNCSVVSLISDPPSGSVFPKGTTTVTTTATDAAGNTSTCTFTVTVEDREAPVVECVPTTNPSGKNVPTAGANPASGKNPDGFYELLARDNCDGLNLAIYVKDSAEGPCGGAFAAGPYAPGTKVKLTQSPGHQAVKPMAGVITAHIQTKGEPVLVVVDSSGNQTCHVCLVPPPPK